MFKKILLIIWLTGFNYCFGGYKSEDIINAIKNNDILYFEKAVQDENFNPNQLEVENFKITALFHVIYRDRKKIFDLLLDLNEMNKCKKIDVNHKAINGNFPLMFACTLHRKYYVEQLLKRKDLIVNAVAYGGCSALFAAINSEEKECFDLLLQCESIDVNIKNTLGVFPLIFACTLPEKQIGIKRKYYIEQLLKHKNININMTDRHEASALYYVVCEKKCHDLVPLFLKHPDIDLNMLYKEKTIGQWAEDRAYDNIAKEIALNTKIPNEQETLINIEKK